MTPLISHDGNRHNNFTTIRICLAWLVLYGHSFAIQKVSGINDPLNHIFEGSIWIGAIAVNGFFAISGFLVAASLVKRGIIDYTISRVLRILPALIVCVFASVFILGPLVTTLSLTEYFSQSQTWNYLSNALGVMRNQATLPGVFENQPRPFVNGSLWTLPVEIRCYLLLGALTFVGFRVNKYIGNLLMLVMLAVGITSFESLPLLGSGNLKAWPRPAMYFVLGVFLYLNRDKFYLDYRIAIIAAIVAYLSFGEAWFQYAFPPALIYLLFYLAYATKPLNTDAVVGDVSYGIYIYAWPIQQVVAQYFPSQSPYFNVLVSTPIVLTLAWLSWHYIEKPMLGYKRVLLGKADVGKLLPSATAVLEKWRSR